MRPSNLVLLAEAGLFLWRNINDTTTRSDADNRLVEYLHVCRFQSGGAIYAHQPQVRNVGVVHTLQCIYYWTPADCETTPVLVDEWVRHQIICDHVRGEVDHVVRCVRQRRETCV